MRMAARWSSTILSPFEVALLLLQPLPLLGGKLAPPPLPSTGPGDELGFAWGAAGTGDWFCGLSCQRAEALTETPGLRCAKRHPIEVHFSSTKKPTPAHLGHQQADAPNGAPGQNNELLWSSD